MNKIRYLPRLLVFAAVAKHGSFTQAADELGITKSAVSQQIKLLEEEIRARLLNRNTRGVALTSLGEKLLRHCQLLQEQVDMVLADIEEEGIAPRGRFAITYPHSLASHVVLPAVAQLCCEFSGLQPELIVSDAVLDLVANNLDAAVYIGELPDSSYRALPIGMMTEVFCASPRYLSRHPAPKTVEELCQHQWIATEWQQARMLIFPAGKSNGIDITLNRFAQVNTLPSAVAMALANMGMALLPDVAARPLLQTGELLHIMPDVTGPNWPVHVLHAYQREKPIHITRFHQLVQRFFSGLQSR